MARTTLPQLTLHDYVKARQAAREPTDHARLTQVAAAPDLARFFGACCVYVTPDLRVVGYLPPTPYAYAWA